MKLLELRYLGVLNLLCECSVYVPKELRDCIGEALNDAQQDNHNLIVKKILDSYRINIKDNS
jgi:tartrate dehydratase alpha subunit/fumarate hydratase class I-like protein